MSDTQFDLATAIPAATVVVFRRAAAGGPPELLMVQRAREMRFAGGAAVFPGGRVDPADRALAAQLAPQADPDIAASKVAGIRETLEETGLAIGLDRPVSGEEAAAARALCIAQGSLAPVLERFDWALDLEALAPFAHWCPQRAGSFDTRFFLADLGSGQVDIAIDATENTRLFWTSAAGALAMDDAREINVIFPTRRNLERLALFASFAEACDHAAQFPIERISPSTIDRDGEPWLLIPDHYGYPVLGQSLASARRG
jgi:8-oxo-dGTP pyrophosphatase MutT (NUDIX family)